MNILFTTNQGNLAGSTHSLIYLAKGLADRGHQVHLACKKEVLLVRELEGYVNISIHEVTFASYLDFNSCLILSGIIRRFQIDLINAQGGRDRNLTILTKWLFHPNVKLVFTRRQRPRNEPRLKRWFHTLGTDRIVMISDGLKRIFLKKGYHDAHLEVIKNGVPAHLTAMVDEGRVIELRRHLGLEDKTVIGCLSRKKSQEQVINALQFLPDHYVVLFVGISERDMPTLNVKHKLIFTGQVDHEAALHYLKLMTINILPSYLDGFGLVLVESMLLGVPVIGSNFGGIPDIIKDGENGFLFENGDFHMLAKRIHSLVEDRSLRQKFISQGMKDARECFSIQRVVSDYERLFQSLID